MRHAQLALWIACAGLACLIAAWVAGCESPPSGSGGARYAQPFQPAPSRPWNEFSTARQADSGQLKQQASERLLLRSDGPQAQPTEQVPLPAADELWVIPRDEFAAAARVMPAREIATPSLRVIDDDGLWNPLPLQSTTVHAWIEGFIATVDVEQVYANPFNDVIEVEYVFPLPHDAAVSDFLMTIGDRTIRGVIRERAEAERIYQEARRQGHVASLMTEERANVFTQRVANIAPGRAIDVDLTYFHTISYDGNAFEWVFPTVVGPRYTPAEEHNGVGAVRPGSEGLSGQPTEITYTDSDAGGPRLALSVEIHAPLPVLGVTSPTHQIKVETVDGSDRSQSIRLANDDETLDRDFILRMELDRGDSSGMLVATSASGDEGYFAMILDPRASRPVRQAPPSEVVFLLDTSGSMEGESLSMVKRTVSGVLEQLRPQDAFQIVRFSDRTSALGSRMIPADREEIARALQYVEEQRADGGTEMIAGLSAVEALPRHPEKDRLIIFFTDGLVSNDNPVVARAAYLSREARLMVIGVGPAPNRSLIQRLASVGRGVTSYLPPGSDTQSMADRIAQLTWVEHLRNVRVSFGSTRVRDVYPDSLPDLYAGQPIMVVGKYSGNAPSKVVLTGDAAGETESHHIECKATSLPPDRSSVNRIWARARIAWLSDEFAFEPRNSLAKDIEQTALRHGISSAYTAFVAVDSLTRLDPRGQRTVRQPASLPQGMSYEQTVR